MSHVIKNKIIQSKRALNRDSRGPEKEAKDQHQKLWEGMSQGGHDLPWTRGWVLAQETCSSSVCFVC